MTSDTPAKKKEGTAIRRLEDFRAATAFMDDAGPVRLEVLRMLSLFPDAVSEAAMKGIGWDKDEMMAMRKSADRYRQVFSKHIHTIMTSGLLEGSGQDEAGLFPMDTQGIYLRMFSENDSLWRGAEILCLLVLPERAVSCWRQLQLLRNQGIDVIVNTELDDASLRHEFEDDVREVYWLTGVHWHKTEAQRPLQEGGKLITHYDRGLTLTEGIALVRHYGGMIPDGSWRLHGSCINRNEVPVLRVARQGKEVLLTSDTLDIGYDEANPRRPFIPTVTIASRYP
jgi:hypothetical protein